MQSVEQRLSTLVGPLEGLCTSRGQTRGPIDPLCALSESFRIPPRELHRLSELSTQLSTDVNTFHKKRRVCSHRRVRLRRVVPRGGQPPSRGPHVEPLRIHRCRSRETSASSGIDRNKCRSALGALLDPCGQLLNLVVHLAAFRHFLTDLLVGVHDRRVVTAERLTDLRQ